MEKKRPFSKLKKTIESLFDEQLKMEFRCISYPVGGQWGRDHAIARFYVKLNKEIIWDYPKDKVTKEFPIDIWARTNGILEMVREFMDTPVDALLTKKFKQEKWGCITA